MISQKHRFHGHHSLDNAYRRGQAVRGELISMRYIATKRPDYRLAVVVSKKVSKSAVVRNRIRRRIYEIVRLYKKGHADPWPIDMIISVFDARVAEMPGEELKATVLRLLNKAVL